MLLHVGEPARRSGAGYRLYHQVDGTIGFSYLTIRKPDLYLTTGRAHNGVYPLIFKVNQHVTTLSTPVLSLLDATPDDMAAVLHIYTHHVLYGAASFEEQPPTLAEMQSRRSKVLEAGLPWLVAKSEGRILGYCYATPYRPRPAYRFTVEDSVYIAEGQQGKGVGKALLHALIARCEQGPWRQMLAIVGDSAANRGSLALHQSLGFTNVGTLKAVGFKLGEWRDTHIMQRALGAGDSTRP